ncbi:phosphoribosylamine--glycine ligase [Candidatus Pacearchaeota archaeon]|nr:phosphoribosylamine--glycine ligase [Candidatus Pacearchaeota archaeon]
MKKILIVGTGGREHALGWNLSKDRDSKILYVAPEKTSREVAELIKKEKIELTIIGPEEPLERGMVDFLNMNGIQNVFGPTKEMTKLESDKFYSYDLMEELGIPQARSVKCFHLFDIKKAIKMFEKPVLKYRGLAGGKGVKVCNSQKEAMEDLNLFLRKFGKDILVAERLYGKEFSVFGIADGKNVLPFKVAFQDYKRLNDGDIGPNTGGMGAYGPVQFVSKKLLKKINEEIMIPVVRRTNYRGFLYVGMILTEDGPKVIEFNARFGDPEAQPAMMLLKDSLYVPLKLSLEGKVLESSLDLKDGASCCVVLALKGYPENYEIGLPISGIEEAEKIEGIKVFHAGTKFENGSWKTNGGRVLDVTSYSRGLPQARDLAYQAASKINIPGGFHHRKDIALF